jgi:O-antigen ligase
MQGKSMTQIMDADRKSWRKTTASVLVIILGIVLFNSVALTNIAVLGLVLLSPFAWRDFFQANQSIDSDAKVFLGLLLTLCGWDVLTNLMGGHGLGIALNALIHDMRKFGFVVLLWCIFSSPHLARIAFWSVCMTVFVMTSVNLLLTLYGFVPHGAYFTTGRWHMSHMSHMYGQALVGLVFVLAQMWLARPSLSWRVLVPIFLLLASLFLASERRTGWFLFLAGSVVWTLLNSNRLCMSQYKWLVMLAGVGIFGVVVSSDVVYRRMAPAMAELNQFFSMTPVERSAVLSGSVFIRLQYVATVVEAIKHSNWLIGVGSVNFPDVYQAAASSTGVTPEVWATYNWSNPHNEYLYMLATKGVVGLALYFAIFVQACRVVLEKKDEVQRVGLLMFVFLFMLSIMTNSMMIDMEEGHFTMLILLIFLAPKSLDLIKRSGKL